MVMIDHFWIGAKPNDGVERGVYHMLGNGWIGVDLFFVLSGFLITGILLDSKGKEGYFRNFYARRALRIFPLYYAFLFVWFYVIPNVIQISPDGPFAATKDSQIWFWTYLSNYLSVIKHIPIPHGLNHIWSLAIEEQFYLVWPFVVLLVSRRTLRAICLLMVAAGFVFCVWLLTTPYAHTGGLVLTPARMGTLAVGAWLASAVREPRLKARVERLAPYSLAASVILLVGINLPDLQMQGYEPVMQTFGFPLLAIAAASIMALAMNSTRRWTWYQKLFRTRVLKFFGKYSYGMYIFHLPVVVAFEGIGLTIVVFPLVGKSDVPGAIVFTLLALATTTLLAYLSWHLYEKQFLRLKSRFVPGATTIRSREAA